MKINKNKKKEKKIQEETASMEVRDKPKRKIWKVTAIVVIVLFAMLIIGGIIKFFYMRSSFIRPTQDQIDFATKIAAEKLQSTGGNASLFDVQTAKKMRRFHDSNDMTIIQVSFYNNVTTHTYLVDVNSGEILLHSETDIYGALQNQHKEAMHERFWNHWESSKSFEHEKDDDRE